MAKFSRILVWGAGNMGGAMLRAWSGRGNLQSGFAELGFVEPHEETAAKVSSDTAARRFLDAQEGVQWADVVILGVKPQVFASAVSTLASAFAGNKPAVSIMAGVKLTALRSALGPQSLPIRTMPNLPLTVGQGTIALATDGLPSDLVTAISDLLAPLGTVVPVQESWMDAVTAVSGSGPAWVFQFIEGLVQGGVLAGLPRATAMELTLSTIEGSVALLRNSGKSPSDLTAMVSSPGGTTIHGLQALESAGFRASLMQAVEAAALRSKVLGG